MFTAAVIGAGRIGAGFENENMGSHALAYTKNPDIKLVGLVDKNENRLKQGKNIWKCPGYASTSELIRLARPDLFSICVDDAYHAEVLEEVLDYKPKLVIVEKPVTTDLVKTKHIIQKYHAAKIPVLVNYSRRYLPIYSELKTWVLEQQMVSATIRYAKGVKHNGCHALDLARFFWGEPVEYRTLTVNHDYLKTDPSVSAFIKFENCNSFMLQALDERHYTHFEVDIFTKKGRYIIDQEHSRLRKFEVKPIVANASGTSNVIGKKLVETDTLKINHDEAMINLINHAVDVIKFGVAPICDMTEAFKSESLAFALAEEVLLEEESR